MSFKPIQKLEIVRALSDGQLVEVGLLAQNLQGTFFQYHDSYLQNYGNLSPFTLKATTELQLAPNNPHSGLHGVFSDSLPDGWGLLLQDRVFRQHGILPSQLTPMDRLAFVNQTAIGALSYQPRSDYAQQASKDISLAQLGLEAQAIFDGQTDEVLTALVAAGSSGGAQPKAQVYFESGNEKLCRTQPNAGDEAWLVKFTSSNLALGHEEGLCEAVYLTLAGEANLSPPEWKLVEAPKQSGAKNWLALKRFDVTAHHSNSLSGRLHMITACGLLDADFRTPSLDYEDLIKASRVVCKSPAVGQLQFKRAMFNLFACNQDDHSKNWAFLQNDSGSWQPAPFYDITFSPHPFGEQSTSFAGFGKQPPVKAIQKLAAAAGFANWKKAQVEIMEIVDTISVFKQEAKFLGVKSETIRLIQKQLDQTWKENKGLLVE